jgi:death-on-curing protein
VFGIAKNHGYQDANKRTAYMAALTFLFINGYRVQATPEEIITLMLAVANDVLDESGIEAWFAKRATRNN